jgi:hypothetical protein
MVPGAGGGEGEGGAMSGCCLDLPNRNTDSRVIRGRLGS